MNQSFLIRCIIWLLLMTGGGLASIKIQISPPIYEQEIRTGEERSFEIYLRNNSSNRITLIARIRSIQMDDFGNPQFIDAPYQPYSCQNWIDLNPRSIQIKPFEERVVAVSIRVPQDASGGNYAAVLFEIDTDNDVSSGTSVGLTIRTGSMIMLSVKNTIKLDAELLSFAAKHLSERTEFEITLQNNSNRHITPSGSIVIFADKKRVIDRIRIESTSFILPFSNRKFKCEWKNLRKREKVERYTAECRFSVKGLGKSLIKRIEIHAGDSQDRQGVKSGI
ncbi:hypothetical protein JXJ21_25700 [candidate division KSB1 bacterium]|nr:hypothetical protein [candidate division KSB1 bacterium]